MTDEPTSGVEAEREACAALVEDQMPATQDMESTEICEALERAAAAIRARAALATPAASPETKNAEAAQAEIDALKALICRIEPYVDAIVCYASTMGEHEPNRIAHEVRAVANGPSQDELVGQQIAARMIAKIDAATAKPGVERAWLIELKGTTPSWAIVNPNDYDEHWTTDSARALRFARKVDAEAYIAHIGWTEAFASEHVWDDGRRSSAPAPETWRGLDDARLKRAIDAFYEPCEGTTIDGVRNAILAWERG